MKTHQEKSAACGERAGKLYREKGLRADALTRLARRAIRAGQKKAA